MGLSEFEIFDQARKLNSPAAKTQFLTEVCSDDEQRDRIEKLILADCDESFLNSPTLDFAELNELENRSGEAIDSYQLIEQIGHGGMGVVYLAKQLEPINRQVAIKLIRTDSPVGQVIPRFESERQALAVLEHPNIARCYDAGTTSRGNPYFVMEYVEGDILTKYCDQRQLNIDDRLALFRQVCKGINHAHSKGIVHRDLKPTNVIVTEIDEQPIAKVIDFGLAMSQNSLLSHESAHTDFGQFLGTLAYMSPEQTVVSSDNIDGRSDVYSLGIVLYELLVGRTPFSVQKFKKGAIDEVFKTIRERDPPTPASTVKNTNLTTEIAKNRQITVDRLRKKVRGDLELIVLKSLEKEPARRYQSAMDLAEDIERFVEHNPVVARRSSMIYRTKKFVRRNRNFFGAVSLAVLALVCGAWMAFAVGENARLNSKQNLDIGISRVKSLIADQELDQASDLLDQLKERHPNNVEFHIVRAHIHKKKKNVNGQMDELNKAIELDAFSFDARLARAMAFQKLDPPNLKKSLVDLQKAAEIQSDNMLVSDQLQSLKLKLPSCSSDGETVIFATNLLGKPVFFSANPDGSQTTPIYIAPKELGPVLIPLTNGTFLVQFADGTQSETMRSSRDGISVSKDLSFIVFQDRTNEPYSLIRMDIDGKNKTTILKDRYVYTPAISPDGSQVAFMIHEKGDFEIAVMNIDGSEFSLVTNSPGRDGGLHHAAWGKHGKRIVFQSERKGHPRRSYIVNLETQKLTELGLGQMPSWADIDELGNFKPRNILRHNY